MKNLLSRLFPWAFREVAGQKQDEQVELIKEIGLARYVGRVYAGFVPDGPTKNPYDAIGRYNRLKAPKGGFCARVVRAGFGL